jgi:hypothetical protein
LTTRPAQSGRLLTAWPAWLAAAGLAAGVGTGWLISQAGPSPVSVPPVPLGALGGAADVTSAPGHGTRVTGRVPGTELA